MEETKNTENPKLAIDLQVRSTQLDVVISNKSAFPLRIWDRSNSWGWKTLSLEVAELSPSSDFYLLSPKPRTFTRNGPGFIEIPVGGTHTVEVVVDDSQWDGIKDMMHIYHAPLLVRAKLNIRSSTEAKTHDIFVGDVKSSWRESPTPHHWLHSP